MLSLGFIIFYVQEKRLRVNMRLRKLHEKVKEQQEKVDNNVNCISHLIVTFHVAFFLKDVTFCFCFLFF